MRSNRKRWMLAGALSGATVSAVIVGALGVFAGSGVAAATAKPQPGDPPTITGSAQEGQGVFGHNGTWKNNPTDFNFSWVRCDKNGGSCATISGAKSQRYRLTSVDVGNTVRFRVEAVNSDGSTFALSAPSSVVTSASSTPPAPQPPSKPPTGCPPGNGPVNVADVTAPARLLLDGQQTDPGTVTRSTGDITVRYHVSNSCGQAVQGALVYTTAVP